MNLKNSESVAKLYAKKKCPITDEELLNRVKSQLLSCSLPWFNEEFAEYAAELLLEADDLQKLRFVEDDEGNLSISYFDGDDVFPTEISLKDLSTCFGHEKVNVEQRQAAKRIAERCSEIGHVILRETKDRDIVCVYPSGDSNFEAVLKKICELESEYPHVAFEKKIVF